MAPAEIKSCTGAAAVTPTKLSAPVKLRWNSVVSSLAPMSAYTAANLRRREIAQAVVLNALDGHEGAPVPLRGAGGQLTLDVAERAAAAVDLGALEVEAVAHHDRHRAAERVETEDRVGADDGDARRWRYRAGSPS